MGPMTFTMNAQGVVDMLAAAGAGLNGVMLKQLEVASVAVRDLMKEKAPVGVGGDKGLRGSIGYVLDPVAMESEIKPAVDYGDAVETRTKPHWPPTAPDSPLAAWAKLKGLNVYAVATSIAKRGTKPHPYISPTFDESKDTVPTLFASGIDAFIQGLLT